MEETIQIVLVAQVEQVTVGIIVVEVALLVVEEALEVFNNLYYMAEICFCHYFKVVERSN